MNEEDLHTIHDPSQYPVATPNGTQVSEYYPKAFTNMAISYGVNGVRETTVDQQGNPIVVCADPNFDVGCVVLDDVNKVITKPLQEFTLRAVAGGDDYYTKVSYTDCPVFIARRLLTASEFQFARSATIGHEAAHGLRVPHSTQCSDLMFTTKLKPQTPNGKPTRITVIDILPIPTDYSSDTQQQMRLHSNQ